MALDATLTPGKQFAATNDDITVPKLNLLGTPTVTVSGDLNQLDNVATTAPSNTQPLVWNSSTSKWGPGQVGVAYLGNGSPTGNLFLRADGNWSDPTSSNVAINLYLNSHLF
jgi:hypothetical protein